MRALLTIAQYKIKQNTWTAALARGQKQNPECKSKSNLNSWSSIFLTAFKAMHRFLTNMRVQMKQ